MRITICGSRGSTPAPGPAHVASGGHTSCVAVAPDAGHPTLVLDAGTGLQRVSALLGGAPFRGTIVLSHLHWDHTHGLPFFVAGDRPDAEVRVLVPGRPGDDPVELLARSMSPPSFPIRPDELRGRWTFELLAEGSHDIGGCVVTALDVPHTEPPHRTVGFRVEGPDGTRLAYLTDHAPHTLGPGRHGVGVLHRAALELAGEADVLIHDAHFTRTELARFPHFGHSCPEYAVELAEAAGARRLLLFHHHPQRDDDGVACLEVAARRRARMPVDAAREGQVVDLAGGRPGGRP